MSLTGEQQIHQITGVPEFLFSRTSWVSRHQNGKTNLDFNEARDDGVAVASAGPYAKNCSSLQTCNHASISSINFFTGWMLFLMPSQRCQSTEGKTELFINITNIQNVFWITSEI